MTEQFDRLSSALADRYRLERELGAGGMATVYLAQDLRHDRPVAVKVLRPELAAVVGADRFLSEIRTTANLQHPHILPLHDSGSVAGTVYYVMPFIDGESLRDRLERERQLPIADAVNIALEVADALKAAHARGIIHRDIKPENILLHDGHALVADFGIALAASQTAGTRMTETGMSLGTPTYMSPEQAMGERTVDARSDVFALGAVTYEMLTGDPPFTGSSAQAIVAKVLTSDPEPLERLRRTVPAHVAATVHAALQKLPADRPASAELFAAGLRGTATITSPVGQAGRSAGARRAPASRGVWIASGVALAATIVAVWGWMRPQAEPLVLHQQLSIDPTEPLSSGMRGSAAAVSGASVALSADGERVAVLMGPGNESRVWVSERSAPGRTELPGTLGAGAVAFAPDGRRLAVIVSGRSSGEVALEVHSLDGSPPRVLSDTGMGNDGVSWSDDGWIYVDGLTGRGVKGLERIRDDGSARELLTQVDTANGELDHVHPVALADGRGVLLTVRTNNGPWVSHLDLKSRRITRLAPGANARYSAPGWLVYTLSGRSLVAQRFNAAKVAVSGQPLVIAPVLATAVDAVDVAVSEQGSLLYISGYGVIGGHPMWVDLTGRAVPVDSALPSTVGSVQISPDGRRLAYDAIIGEAPHSAVFVKSLPDGVATPIPVPPALTILPSWSADGRTLFVLHDATSTGNRFSLWRLDPSGAAPPQRVPGGTDLGPVTVWRDQLFSTSVPGGMSATETRVTATRGTGDTLFLPLFGTERKDEMPRVSPDGRYIAYRSVQGADRYLYLRRFPDVETGRWLISNGPVSSTPLWSPDGRTVYIVNQQRQVEAITLRDTDGDVQVASRSTLFDASQYWIQLYSGWDLAPDGSRFVMLRPRASSESARLFAIDGLPVLLERKAARER